MSGKEIEAEGDTVNEAVQTEDVRRGLWGGKKTLELKEGDTRVGLGVLERESQRLRPVTLPAWGREEKI